MPAVTEIHQPELGRRLAALADGLRELPPDTACPWSLGNVFNQLLRQAKREIPGDPVVRNIRFIEEGRSSNGMAVSDQLVVTIRVLATQLTAALDGAAREANGAGRVKRTATA